LWASPNGPKSVYTDDSRTSPPDDLADWDRFVRAVAEQYRGRIGAYELWDMANHSDFFTGSMAELGGYDHCDAGAVKLSAPTPTRRRRCCRWHTTSRRHCTGPASAVEHRLRVRREHPAAPGPGSRCRARGPVLPVRAFRPVPQMYFYNWGSAKVPIVSEFARIASQPREITSAPAGAAGTARPGAAGVGDYLFPGLGNGGYDATHYTRRPKRKSSSSRRRGPSAADGSLWRSGSHPTPPLRRRTTCTRSDGSRQSGTRSRVFQPDAAHRAIPVNDHSSDKATWTFTLDVPQGVTAVANGVPTKRESVKGRTTWTYEERSPLATELIQLAVGDDLSTVQRERCHLPQRDRHQSAGSAGASVRPHPRTAGVGDRPIRPVPAFDLRQPGC
jgi:hypothetical protein